MVHLQSKVREWARLRLRLEVKLQWIQSAASWWMSPNGCVCHSLVISQMPNHETEFPKDEFCNGQI
jgi:hypothetical protein